jgi:hypothetical protein
MHNACLHMTHRERERETAHVCVYVHTYVFEQSAANPLEYAVLK